jgi:chromosome segregation ATPase
MPKRLLRDARLSLEEEVLPRTNDYMGRQHSQFLQAAEMRARQRAEALLEEREREIQEARDSILRELTEVRDELHELAEEGKQGRISSPGYMERLDSLRMRQREADEHLSEVEQAVEQIETVEDDPIGWADDLASRYPRLREEFPW